jgi:hypothetical protein|tara:strand:+ start:4157 stop:4354 length:198 start_codon:yes stop_codon:yes gene_type:complete
MKDIPAGNPGLGKLPTPVRNKMGYKKYGGAMKKMRNGGAMCSPRKEMAGAMEMPRMKCGGTHRNK